MLTSMMIQFDAKYPDISIFSVLLINAVEGLPQPQIPTLVSEGDWEDYLIAAEKGKAVFHQTPLGKCLPTSTDRREYARHVMDRLQAAGAWSTQPQAVELPPRDEIVGVSDTKPLSGHGCFLPENFHPTIKI